MSPQRIVLLGATGGCADVLDTIHDVNARAPEPVYDCVGLLDDDPALHGTLVLDTPVLGPFALAGDYAADCVFATAIGSEKNYHRRAAVLERLGVPLERFATIVHPTASISRFATLGPGCIVHQHVAITRDVVLGARVLVLPGTVVSHGARIGAHSIVNARVCIAGDVRVEESCYVGAGSAIRQDVTVGARSLVGMGAVVVRDVPPASVVVGNPARVVRAVDGSE